MNPELHSLSLFFGLIFAWFRTAHPFRNRWTFTLRNHRKVQIIDGAHVFVGGMNMGREYAGRSGDRTLARS